MFTMGTYVKITATTGPRDVPRAHAPFDSVLGFANDGVPKAQNPASADNSWEIKLLAPSAAP